MFSFYTIIILYIVVILVQTNRKGDFTMGNIESLKLFNDLKLVSTKYTHLQLKDEKEEVESNRKLKTLLSTQSSRIEELREKVNFVHSQTISELTKLNTEDIYSVVDTFNKFSQKRFDLLRVYADTLSSTTVKAVLNSTLDELSLVNQSIDSKEYTNNKESHIILYYETVVNAFATFLALKEMMDDEDAVNGLSQGIFNQMKTISIVSTIH